jgi:DNA-binding transcriptional LysR family regulator
MTCHLLSDEHVCLMRSGHSNARKSLSLEKYLAADHLLLSMSTARNDEVDDALATQGLARRIAMRVPHALAAIIALTRSDMLASVTRGAANIFAESGPLVCTRLPFSVPPAEFRLVWNRRVHHSPSHVWLRRKLIAIATNENASAKRISRR